MDRIYASGAAGSAPSVPASPSSGYPTGGNPGTGTPATKPGAYWYHMVMEELMAIITAGGIAPAPGTLNQVKQALDALYMPITASVGSSVQGSFKNLALSATGTGANVTISADEIVVENSSNAYKTLRSVGLTVAGVSSGVANGLDTGALAASTWYSVWVIAKADGTTAGLVSLSSTAPTLPSGYTFKARVGWIRTDGTANKYPLSFVQFGRRVFYKPASGSNLTALPQMASGVAGSIATPTYVAVATGNFIPPTAGQISALAAHSAVASGCIIVAPNNSYGPSLSITNPPPIDTNSNGGNAARGVADMSVESSNIYWAAVLSTSALFCRGWEDNI
jgi:hypothetical protein